MSYLLFLDESGHDHRTCPYEVRGGVAIHAGKIWPFIRAVQNLEYSSFGGPLREYKRELKGSHLLDKDRFIWAAQAERMSDEERRKLCRSFLTKGLEKKTPTRPEFTAYGQACIDMASGLFQLLRSHEAVLFAAAIPCSVARPVGTTTDEYLRKDHVFLLERYFYFLEAQKAHGLLVMDETERTEDARFARRLEGYFTKTQPGKYRSQWIVPSPFFVASDLTYPVQAADLCIYCVNWGFRLPKAGVDAPARREIADLAAGWLDRLQFVGDGYRDGTVFRTYGIIYVQDPYTGRESG